MALVTEARRPNEQLTRFAQAQVRHSLTAHGLEVVRDLDHFAATEARGSAAEATAEPRTRLRAAAPPPRATAAPDAVRCGAPAESVGGLRLRPHCHTGPRSHASPFPQLTDLLKPVEKCWQCQDFMPDPSSPTFADEVCPLAPTLCIDLP